MFMKNYYFIYLCMLSLISVMQVTNLNAQGLAINGTGAPADTSAMLDVASTAKGLLMPRMTAAQCMAIALPATGLMVYQTDGTAGYYYYNGSAWTTVSSAAGWGLTGNSRTNSGTNFLGTTDSAALRFRVDNVWVRPDRKISLSMKWLIRYSRERNGKTIADKLANEIIAAAKGEGGAFKKKEDTHRMAEANKAFSHFKI